MHLRFYGNLTLLSMRIFNVFLQFGCFINRAKQVRELLNKHFEEEVENNYHIFNNKGPERSRLLHNRLRTCIFKLHLNYVFSLTVEEFDLKKKVCT